MSKPAPNPFAQLLGVLPVRLPATTSHQLVVSGKRLTDLRQLNTALDLQAEDCADKGTAERLRKEKQRAYNQARYQADRQDPEKMAKRKAWAEANREKIKSYKQKHLQKNKQRQLELAARWARENYAANPEAARQKGREYYARNREAILAKLQAQRDAAKAAKAKAKEEACA